MRIIMALILGLIGSNLYAQNKRAIFVESGMYMPAFPCYGPNGALYCTDAGVPGKDGTGVLCRIDDGKAVPFVKDLQHPRGIVYSPSRKAFFVADEKQVLKIDDKGKMIILVTADKFPKAIISVNGLALDEQSQVLLTCGGGGVCRINLKTLAVDAVAGVSDHADFNFVSAVLFDGVSQCLVTAGQSLYRFNLTTREVQKICDGMTGANCIIHDAHGRLYLSLISRGIVAIPRPGVKPISLMSFPGGQYYGACLDAAGTSIIYSPTANGLNTISASIPGWEVDTTPLAIEAKPAFPKLKWTGWDDGSDSGKVIPHRPIQLLPAPDGSNRNVAVLQQGTIHIFDNIDDATATKVMLDHTRKVKFLEKQNEEGLLGIAFHPQFKTKREVYLFYTDAAAKLTNVVSRFTMKADDPDTIDPASEKIILKIEKPYWNHDGGTIVFGPDGCLYITHGDGGLGGDPHGNGQNLNTHLGKILRINIDVKTEGREYSIPADNPFVNDKTAKPEIYAYGFRNLWRMAFDKADGRLWAADVGQNLYEEINIVKAGGNYGWSIREGLHPFGPKGREDHDAVVDPVWEYHHDIGKSITGGQVYRGGAIPELQGLYLYADYVTPKIWALKYDTAKNRVTANRPIPLSTLAVMSFGEDAQGEVYVMGATATTKGILRITKK